MLGEIMGLKEELWKEAITQPMEVLVALEPIMQVLEVPEVMEVMEEEPNLFLEEVVLTQDLQGRKGLQSMDKRGVTEVMEALIVMVIWGIEPVTVKMVVQVVQVLTLL